MNKLKVSTKLKYGIGDFGMSLVSAMLSFSMLFYYTDVVGVNPGLAGTAILVGKLCWDMVNDVLFGYFEDKTKSRWGKRRPYLIFCSIPFALAFWSVFSIPQGLGNVAYFFLIIGTFILFDTFHTLIATAYSSMTAEITEDYQERTSLSTVRMVFSVVGYLMGAGVISPVAGLISDGLNITLHQGWGLTALAFGIIAAISLLIPGLFLKYKPAIEDEPNKAPLPVKSIFTAFKNKPFVIFLIISSIMSISFTMVTTMLNYYIEHQLMMGDKGIFIMLAMLGVLAIFLVPCGILCNKIGKAKTYALGLAIASTALLVVFFLPKGESPFIFVLAAIVGLGFSAQWVCPHSMIPDVIEYDELLTGERREGLYYGINGTAGKVTGALASAVCGWGLELGKYIEVLQPGEVQPDSALLAIKIMFAIIPAVFLLICIPMLLKYPITKKNHAEVMKKLEEKRKEREKHEN